MKSKEIRDLIDFIYPPLRQHKGMTILKMLQKASQKLGYEFDIQGTFGYTKMLENQLNGEIDSWAVRWYASVFLNNGMCLHPARSLTNNIGHDGTGVHCGPSDTFAVDLRGFRPVIVKQEVKEHFEGLIAVKGFLKSLKQPLYRRFLMKISRIFTGRE